MFAKNMFDWSCFDSSRYYFLHKTLTDICENLFLSFHWTGCGFNRPNHCLFEDLLTDAATLNHLNAVSHAFDGNDDLLSFYSQSENCAVTRLISPLTL